MRFILSESATITGDPASVWQVVTDVSSWPAWDPHVKDAGFDGPFETGGVGWTRPKGGMRGPFTITSVDVHKAYTTESVMPMGMMYVTNRYEPIGPGTIEVFREYDLHGGFVPTFKLFYAKKMRRDLKQAFINLEQEVARRASSTGAAQ
jgi:hypothetical protein